MTGSTRHLQSISASPTPEEAAAIVAAIERFMRATAPAPAEGAPGQLDGWRAAAVLEGASRDPWADGGGWLARAGTSG